MCISLPARASINYNPALKKSLEQGVGISFVFVEEISACSIYCCISMLKHSWLKGYYQYIKRLISA